MPTQRQAILFAISAVMLWSTVTTAFKLTLQYVSPIELLVYSSIFSTLILTLILYWQKKLKRIFRCTPQEYLFSLFLGFLSPFLYYLVLFEAYDLLPAQQAQTINYTWAINLTLLSVPLLKQKISWPQLLALIISYFGVVVISTEGDPLGLNITNPFGVFLALVSTVIWALYWIYNTRDKRDPVVGLLLSFLFGLPLILGYYLLTQEVRFVPIQGLLGAAYVGAFEMGICFVLWLMAMKLTDNTAKISNLIFLSPFASLIFINVILGEEIVVATYIGLVLIVAGLLIQQYKSNSIKSKNVT